MSTPEWTPVTHASCSNVAGPFYHGTCRQLAAGDLLVPGFASNYEAGRISNNVYFSSLLEPAIWGAELSSAYADTEGRGHIYVVEPTGTFEDDPNLTNKRFPGNPTRSYRTRAALRVISELKEWTGHPPEVLQRMLDNLAEKKRNGLAVIED